MCFKFNRGPFAASYFTICIILTSIISRYCCYGYLTSASKFHYETKEFEVPVDHFNFALNETFKIRYLFNNSFVDQQSASAPLFFYTGNEGDIETFAQNTGFMWELAQKLRAGVIFAEHRYYGKSMPFGNQTFNVTQNYGYLSVEQTLEDFVCLITSLRDKYKFGPVIAFGGSYGGMLSAWIRIKYPHVVHGALAASAPVRQFDGLVSCDIFGRITTSVYLSTFKNQTCTTNIRKSWDMFKQLVGTDDGRKKLNGAFNFCKPILSEKELKQFFEYLEDVYVNLAMANYPYANDFLNPLPPYPVRQFCSYLQNEESGDKLLAAMRQAIDVYANFTGAVTCLNYESAFDPNSIGGDAWDIQTCNQMVMPMCYGEGTMFLPKEWNFKEYTDECESKFHLKPRLHDITMRYGGENFRYASNIIFSNGLLDPWSGGGVFQSDNGNIEIIIIPEGAHHLDLRSTNEHDPPSVLQARAREGEIISKWISDYHW